MTISELPMMTCDAQTDPQIQKTLRQKVQALRAELRDNERTHNSYEQERREQACVRCGDTEGLCCAIRELEEEQLGVLSHDSLRNIKDIAIVVITLSSRSAIEGGISPELAFSMTDSFIQLIESEQSGERVHQLYRAAEMEFCLAVRDSLRSDTSNPLIVRCRDLISRRIHQRLTVADLAKTLHTHPDYLSQLFSQEETLSLSEYIAREKIRVAAGELMFADRSINEIAAAFSFSSQSHFGKVFKKWTGMTPQQYRKLYKGK